MAGSTNLPERVGRYEIRRIVGQGAMGRVLLAHDPVLGRDVAIKMLRGDLEIGPEVRDGLLRRMRHEAQAAARVSHPNIVTLHDMIDDDHLGVCLVFEFVRGKTLKEGIAQGRLPASEVAAIARQMGSALALAHKGGVLHRDVKPENIMLADYGAKVTDFGIARVPDSTLTRAGGLLGTPAYSAPECISGGNFSARSDQFSLAATLYEAASGRRAFPGDDAVTVAARIGTEEPAPFAVELGLDPKVDAVLARGLSKDADKRHPDCEEFGEALARALEASSTTEATSTLVDVAPPTHPPSPRPLAHWASVAIGGAFVGALCAIVLVTLSRSSPPSAFDLAAARDNPTAGSSGLTATPTSPLPPPTKRNRPDTRVPASADPDRDAGAAQLVDAAQPPVEVDASTRDVHDGALMDAAKRSDGAAEGGSLVDAHRDGSS